MKERPKIDLGMTGYDELFMNDQERAENRLPKIYDIPLSEIDEFPDHPFKVKDDEDMLTVIQIIQYNSLTYYGALTKYGTDIPLAACGIVMKTNAIILAIVTGISQGMQPIIGFNYGARQYHRVREAYMLAIKWNLVVSTIAFIAFQFFPRSIISLFGDGDELYFEFAVLFMRTYIFMVLVNGVQLLSSDFFTAIGKALKGALLALTRQTFVLIPLTLLLPLRFGIMGVLLAGPVADFSAFMLSVVLVGIELKKQKNDM